MNVLPALRGMGAVALAVLLGVAGGCREKNPPPSATALSSNTSRKDVEGRLKAALGISSTLQRDAALASVAKAAGELGEADLVKSSLGAISSTLGKDTAAIESAVALAGAGKRTEAAEVARMISDTSKRDATLSRLARD